MQATRSIIVRYPTGRPNHLFIARASPNPALDSISLSGLTEWSHDDWLHVRLICRDAMAVIKSCDMMNNSSQHAYKHYKQYCQVTPGLAHHFGGRP